MATSTTKRGYLLTFEGGEGGGKTTQIVRLREKLTSAGHDVVVLREPGGTTIGEKIRDLLLDKANAAMAFTTEVLLFQAQRAQIYREIILPSLEAGKTVILSRTRDSSVVYQGYVRGFDIALIEQLNDIATKNTMPDLTILLDVPVEVGLARTLSAGELDRIESEGKAFHQKVREAFLDLAEKNDGERWEVVDASESIEDVENAIWQAVSDRLEL